MRVGIEEAGHGNQVRAIYDLILVGAVVNHDKKLYFRVTSRYRRVSTLTS